ncbi:hypothetical protein J3459_010184 [Metarhizium acridum]|nr:hypothetical protein J3459_010184 [Metarhizium acridum]
MVDRSVDAVGYQAMDSRGSSEQPNIVLENMIRVTRPCGGLGIPGLYVASGYSFEFDSDPGAPDTAAAKGMISLSFGKLFEKVSCTFMDLSIRTSYSKPVTGPQTCNRAV